MQGKDQLQYLCGAVVLSMLLAASPMCRCQEGQELIFGGSIVAIEDLPYHVAIYEIGKSPGAYDQICGGTLISQKHVVSAGHCFWDAKKSVLKSSDRYRVAAGKNLRSWRARGKGNAVQQRLVVNIAVPRRFLGRTLFFANDIAVLTLNKEVALSNWVALAQVDWYDTWTGEQLVPGSLGVVAGWGITDTEVPSSNLRSVSLPYVDQDTCFDAQQGDLKRWVTHDKFCAGFANKSISVCPGDSGGGLVFFHPGTNKHYLRGVVSVAFKPAHNKDPCYAQHYTGFTLVKPDLVRGLIRSSEPQRTVLPSECGRRPRTVTPLIAGGRDAHDSEFPWNAAVYRTMQGKLSLICQGSLISLKFVLSAAHCFYDIAARKLQSTSLFRISLGGNKRSVTEDASVQSMDVSKISIPQLFLGHSTSYNHDIAVVELATEAVITSSVSPICVDWDNSFEDKQLREGGVGIVAAWGLMDNGDSANTLQWIEVPYVTLDTCLEFARSRSVENLLSTDKFCAGQINGTQTICQGDSGAGYWVLNATDQRYYLRGIVSSQIAGNIGSRRHCQRESYIAFSRISSYLQWIRGFLLSPELYE